MVLTPEERRARARDRYAQLKEDGGEVWEEYQFKNRANFKNWYESRRNWETGEYPRRAENLARKALKIEHDRKVKAIYREKNRAFLREQNKAYRRGLLLTKKMWDSWVDMTDAEREKLRGYNEFAPAVVRPEGLVLRREVNAPSRTNRGEIVE